MSLSTVCRLCSGACGVLATVHDGVVTSVVPDPSDPVSRGAPCSELARVPQAMAAENRITSCLKRDGDRWVPVPRAEAVAAIGTALQAALQRRGPDALGFVLGRDSWSHTRDTVRTLSVAMAVGTPHVFSSAANDSVPLLRAAEAVLGHPALLLSDLSRAHYVVVFDGGQAESDWGPHRRGLTYADAIRHSQRTKGTRLVVVGPQRTPLAEQAHEYVAIRPGTEPFFLLGMLSATVTGEWIDRQFIRDYTDGWDALREALAAWPVERCADVCGVPAAHISGVALKFGRAAMAVAHVDGHVLHNPAGSLGAWASLALHAVTANLLRPGGLYDFAATFDLHHPLAVVTSERGPKTASGHPLVGLQAAAALVDDHVGQGVQAWVLMDADPVGEAASPETVAKAFQDADVVVALAHCHSATTAVADWVLPLSHPFEEDELEVFGGTALPEPVVRRVASVATPPGDAASPDHWLRVLAGALTPRVRGGAYGLHLGLAARALWTSDLARWEDRIAEWGTDLDLAELSAPPHRLERGLADRSLWRVSRAGGRIALMPDAARVLFDALRVPEAGALWLRTSRATPRGGATSWAAVPSAEAWVHSAQGLAAGTTHVLCTAHGRLSVTIRHDDRLRPDVVDVLARVPGVSALVAPSPRDPWTGRRSLDGTPCWFAADE